MTKTTNFSERPLGRYVHHDPRSLQYPYLLEPTATVASVKHTRYIPVLDQGNLGSCTGNATVGALGTGDFYATIPAGTSLDETLAVKIYEKATTLDNVPGSYPPTDTGSSGLAVAKAAQGFGFISGYQHALNTTAALAALAAKPIIVGVNWYEGFDRPDSSGHVSISGSVRGGHEFVLDELNVEGSYVGATNSWGTTYGEKGRFFFSFDALDQLLSEQGDATVFVENTSPTPTPVPIPVDDPDQVLYNETQAWAYASHYFPGAKHIAKSLRDWYLAKGL